ncbi:AMP-binding protein [Frankia sp. CNm7]|uniref:AMP-binding protein n=1 Tax=Frankia nepalensis TaxID=1836974 RepID=A0A937RT49_9ACTN|nr:AMP-binding protein [Frankia nepalensis]MBL7495053.1 AMP-binding protein [Frankia nepalensis]MBL7515245.1 AMP-binding protein [Frankia nepalensis]MBL7522189.1 AMP-binding protein [Frankia nepalensis]MBL7632303.1 AMP-binding protein [Frankia nepalensis]
MTTKTPIEHPKRFAAATPDKPAVIAGDVVVTYAELEARSNRLAHALRAAGLDVGDNLAVLMENRAEYFEIVWAGMRAGLRVTPINWHLSAAETEYIVTDCGAAALVASAACADVVASLGEAGPKVRLAVGGPIEGFEPYERAVADFPATPLDDECEGNWMFYSSGTTGRPKGIRPPEVGGPLGEPTSFSAMVRFLFGGDESTRYLSPAPLYHAAPSGWTNAVHRIGGTVVITERFDPEEFLQTVEREKITLAQVVPTHMVRLLKLPAEARARHDLSSLKVLVHAAAPCPVEVKRGMLDWLGPVIHEYYAGSEGVGFCYIGPEEWLAHPGSVGRSMQGAVHILDELGEEVPPGTDGRVFFESTRQFEYHGDPAKTAEVFDKHGWATYGEIGHVDADGYLYLTDRATNMIVSGGVNIYPREIEDVLIGHPEVADVAVIGVPDGEMGESVRAVVQPAAYPPADPAALEADLIAFCRANIAHFKAPRSVRFLEALPRLATGKIARRLLPPEVRA